MDQHYPDRCFLSNSYNQLSVCCPAFRFSCNRCFVLNWLMFEQFLPCSLGHVHVSLMARCCSGLIKYICTFFPFPISSLVECSTTNPTNSNTFMLLSLPSLFSALSVLLFQFASVIELKLSCMYGRLLYCNNNNNYYIPSSFVWTFSASMHRQLLVLACCCYFFSSTIKASLRIYFNHTQVLFRLQITTRFSSAVLARLSKATEFQSVSRRQ